VSVGCGPAGIVSLRLKACVAGRGLGRTAFSAVNVEVDDVVSDGPKLEVWTELTDSEVGDETTGDGNVEEAAEAVEDNWSGDAEDEAEMATVEVSTLEGATAGGGLEVSTRRPEVIDEA